MVQQLSSVNHLHSMTLERLSTHSSVQFISLSITVFKVGVLLLSVYRTFYSEPPFACLPRRLEWNSSARGKSSHTFHCQGKCSALNKALHGESRFGKKDRCLILMTANENIPQSFARVTCSLAESKGVH